MSDPTGSYSFAYDNMGRLIGTTTHYAFLPALNFQNAYTYDAASNRVSLTAPDNSITTYAYDNLNRLNGMANSWAGSFGFGYDALSRRTSLTRPNGVNTGGNRRKSGGNRGQTGLTPFLIKHLNKTELAGGPAFRCLKPP